MMVATPTTSTTRKPPTSTRQPVNISSFQQQQSTPRDTRSMNDNASSMNGRGMAGPISLLADVALGFSTNSHSNGAASMRPGSSDRLNLPSLSSAVHTGNERVSGSRVTWKHGSESTRGEGSASGGTQQQSTAFHQQPQTIFGQQDQASMRQSYAAYGSGEGGVNASTWHGQGPQRYDQHQPRNTMQSAPGRLDMSNSYTRTSYHSPPRSAGYPSPHQHQLMPDRQSSPGWRTAPLPDLASTHTYRGASQSPNASTHHQAPPQNAPATARNWSADGLSAPIEAPAVRRIASSPLIPNNQQHWVFVKEDPSRNTQPHGRSVSSDAARSRSARRDLQPPPLVTPNGHDPRQRPGQFSAPASHHASKGSMSARSACDTGRAIPAWSVADVAHPHTEPNNHSAAHSTVEETSPRESQGPTSDSLNDSELSDVSESDGESPEDHDDEYVPGGGGGRKRAAPPHSPRRLDTVKEEPLVSIDDLSPNTTRSSARLRTKPYRDDSQEYDDDELQDVHDMDVDDLATPRAGGKKRQYVRRDANRRKLQNAQAQKKFRWKKKLMAEQMKLDLDEQLLITDRLRTKHVALEAAMDEKDRLLSRLRNENGQLKRRLTTCHCPQVEADGGHTDEDGEDEISSQGGPPDEQESDE